MNRVQIIIFGAIGAITLVALLLVTGVLPGFKERAPDPFTLTVWGFRDAREIWEPIAMTYRDKVEPSATIGYVKKNPATYDIELLDALAAGRGPDIFLLTDVMLVNYQDKTISLPDGSPGYEKKSFKNLFADGVVSAITDASNALAGTPLSFDVLALFYNRDHLNAANIPTPPQTWEELVEQLPALTKLSTVGGIQRSGIALGTSVNVDHAADILSALIYQSGGTFVDSSGQHGEINSPAVISSLVFYTSFANPAKKTYSWNSFFDSSLRSFANGDTSIAIGYAADAQAIAARNPQLNFDVAPLPRPIRAKTPATLGRLDVAVVSRTSREREQAWRFLLWLQSRDIQKTYIDTVGLPPARRDLTRSKPPREYLTPFYDQVLLARTLPLAIGGSLERILGDMIDAVADRRFSIDQAVARATEQITAELERKHETSP